jgi:hypothetical protein
VYKAIPVGDKRKAQSLQKLILKSTSAILLAIRQVTQLNAEKKIGGIDGKTVLSFEQRFELSEKLRTEGNNWKHQGLREILISKKDGKTRILKVPTIVITRQSIPISSSLRKQTHQCQKCQRREITLGR